jgi:hypothetical protein
VGPRAGPMRPVLRPSGRSALSDDRGAREEGAAGGGHRGEPDGAREQPGRAPRPSSVPRPVGEPGRGTEAAPAGQASPPVAGTDRVVGAEGAGTGFGPRRPGCRRNAAIRAETNAMAPAMVNAPS